MSKIFKMISTAMIAVGLLFLFLYLRSQGGNRLEILECPSYYITQNYWFVFLAGIAVLLFSLLGSFFSWFKHFDAKEEILPNAGYATEQQIHTWVRGTAANAENDEMAVSQNGSGNTEVLSDKTGLFGEEDT